MAPIARFRFSDPRRPPILVRMRTDRFRRQHSRFPDARSGVLRWHRGCHAGRAVRGAPVETADSTTASEARRRAHCHAVAAPAFDVRPGMRPRRGRPERRLPLARPAPQRRPVPARDADALGAVASLAGRAVNPCACANPGGADGIVYASATTECHSSRSLASK